MLKNQQAISSRAFAVRNKRVGQVHVISLCGQVDVGNRALAQAQLEAALEEAGTQLVIDTRELESIDAAGVAALIGAISSRKRVQTLRLIPGRAPAVADALAVNGIDGRAMLADPRPRMSLRASGSA